LPTPLLPKGNHLSPVNHPLVSLGCKMSLSVIQVIFLLKNCLSPSSGQRGDALKDINAAKEIIFMKFVPSLGT